MEHSGRLQALVAASALTRRFPIWARYLASTVIVGLALAVRVALGSLFGDYFFLTFFPAVVLCALLFDRGNGIWATLLSAAAVAYYFVPPGESSYRDPHHLAAIALFIGSGIAIAIVLEIMHLFIEQLADAHERAVVLARELENSDKAKDILLEEMMHRIKNELAMVTSMLELQSRASTDAASKQAISAAANRVHVLARVHERLRRRGSEALVDLGSYLGDLCDELRMSLLSLKPVSLRTEFESHFLTVDKAVPVGLILNELLTNAIKYAFPDERMGSIIVRLFQHDGELCLLVRDDGVGISSSSGAGGMGQRIVRALTSQLNGTIEIAAADGGGTECRVCFPSDGALNTGNRVTA